MDHFDIAIIGTGSGNTILDERYADKRIAICEQGVFGGTCINVGCIPTKMFAYAADVAQSARDSPRFGVDARVDGVRWSEIVSRVFGRIDPLVMSGEQYRRCSPNVKMFTSHTRFAPTMDNGRHKLRTDDGDEFSADQVVIAAGARATVPDAIARSGLQYHTSNTIMRVANLPEHLVIVGGGFIATEFAHIFSELGSRVTLVIRGGTLLSQCDDALCARFTDIAGKNWSIRSRRNVVGGTQDDFGMTLDLDDGSRLQADALLVSTGRIPNGDLLNAEVAGVKVIDGRVMVDEYQRTTARGIYALGDVSSRYQLKHVANHEARVVKHNLLADWDDTATLMRADHRHVPSAVFTDPQIAMVGLTEKAARAGGYNVRSKVQDYADVAYGWALEDTIGFAKIVVDDDTGQILGAHIMGHQAALLIQPLIQGMRFGLTAQDMARGQYWIHPSLSELIENALLAVCGEPPWPPRSDTDNVSPAPSHRLPARRS
ncbi:mycothione reductase [Mycobacterium sp. E2479]|uniref:mycothione reductase n=1 Tax=Mycobacterium sp. E2479 TaxID=1834134 RepID=UPI0007FE7312|nr:mycothione reductase [Mycobacterium sp. E2479]OBH60714.1 mycothione reductase [Mycobacterium sp. E2479]